MNLYPVGAKISCRAKKHYEEIWLKDKTLLEVTRIALINAQAEDMNAHQIEDYFYEESYYNWLRKNKRLKL